MPEEGPTPRHPAHLRLGRHPFRGKRPGYGVDQSQRPELAHADDDPGATYGCVARHDDALILAGVLGVLLARAARCEVTFESGHQNTEVDCGLATAVVLWSLQPLRIIEFAMQHQQIRFALGHGSS